MNNKEAAEEESCTDAISRRAVLEINESHHGEMPNHINHRIWEEIKALPPVQTIPCEDAVSREAVEDIIMWYDGQGEILKQIMDLPSVTPKQRTGHWIMPVQDDGMSDPIYYQVRCSKCGFDLDPQTWHMELHQYGADKFCPNCGAKMEEQA